MAIEKPETPEEFCWLYAVGCLEGRLTEKTLDHEDYLLALEYIKNCEIPPAVLIRQWFPKPFEKLEKDGVPCSLFEMMEYWRNRHKQNEYTPVHIGKITLITKILGSSALVRVSIHCTINGKQEQKKDVGLNLHNYDLEIDDVVFIHGTVVAEKV